MHDEHDQESGNIIAYLFVMGAAFTVIVTSGMIVFI